MSRTIVDIHVLQTLPPSNLNRDDTGSPKTAVYGNARRARVSSQAWKRATRRAFNEHLDPAKLGVRTKRIVDQLGKRLLDLAPEMEPDATQALATAVFGAVGIKITEKKNSKKDSDEDGDGNNSPESGYLVFLSAQQLDNLAAAALAAVRDDEQLAQSLADRDVSKLTTGLKKQDMKRLADSAHSVDVALFGRMVADMPDINVDAATQVAHALSVHAVENEFDYYTAVDDVKNEAEETGAGMIGTVEFNSATFYRYASVDADRLCENLGDVKATQEAVEAFLSAFVTSMPTGKQNTFGNRTLPDLVLVRLRETQPISFVGAFEEAVDGRGGSRVRGAVEALVEYASGVEAAYGEQSLRSMIVRVGERTAAAHALGDEVSLDDLVATVGSDVAARGAA